MHMLDIRKIARAGLLKPGCSFSWQWTGGSEKIASSGLRTETDHVVLDYRSRSNGDEWQDMHYPVYLPGVAATTAGSAPGGSCRAVGCGRRVAVLFGGKVYACRHCHKLAYRTQREQPHDRAGSKADKLRDRLGWEAGILNGNGNGDKGTHWGTFERLQARQDALVNETITGMTAKLGMAMERLDGIKHMDSLRGSS